MKTIFLSPPHMGGSEKKFIEDAFLSNYIAPIGPNLDLFEKRISEYLNVNSSLALSSGTSAIHLALLLAGVEKGDDVLCQSFTFAATANPILYLNANPIFIDSENETWNMDPLLLENAIQDRLILGKLPKACIVVHLYGMPAKMVEIKAICKKYNIVLIEDAAEALGSKINGEFLGTLGDYGVFSFNGNKIITTSGGGALVSSSFEKIEIARFLSSQAKDPAPHYLHSKIGYNYRMSNISAGIGLGQMEVLNDWIQRRNHNFDFYKSRLPYKFQELPNGFFSNRWLTTIVLKDFEEREGIRMKLLNDNIECRPLWKPLHTQPVFKECISYISGVSEDLFDKGLCLPSGSSLSFENLNLICETILS